MSVSKKVETALRTALRFEDVSVRRRLPRHAVVPHDSAAPAAEAGQHKAVALGESDLERLAALGARLLPALGKKQARSLLIRAALRALESLDDQSAKQLLGQLPSLLARPRTSSRGKGKRPL